MSSVNTYVTHPPTRGKVTLHTSHGALDIELFSKEAPLACANFVQLCLECGYDGTPFHRVIKGVLVQGGDPTGTGTGGESVYGRPFPDEFHSRLRFAGRGMVAMANPNLPNANQSQFFITLGATPWLDKKHTVRAWRGWGRGGSVVLCAHPLSHSPPHPLSDLWRRHRCGHLQPAAVGRGGGGRNRPPP